MLSLPLRTAAISCSAAARRKRAQSWMACVSRAVVLRTDGRRLIEGFGMAYLPFEEDNREEQGINAKGQRRQQKKE